MLVLHDKDEREPSGWDKHLPREAKGLKIHLNQQNASLSLQGDFAPVICGSWECVRALNRIGRAADESVHIGTMAEVQC